MKFPKIVVIGLALLAMACRPHEPQIITTAEPIAHGEWQCFYNEFSLICPTNVELRIAADTKYWLWLNGELVVREGGLKRGPNPKDSYCDVLRNLPNLKFGKNRVVVLVQYYGHNSFSHRPSAVPGIYFDLTTPLDHIVSSEGWKAVRYDAMWAAPVEHNLKGYRKYRLAGANVGYDARKALDFGKDIDTEDWVSAVVVERDNSDWGELIERPTPQWRWSELCDYEGKEWQGRELVCSLPYNAQVTPYIKLRAKGGERIKICTDDYWVGPARSFYTEYIAREGEQEFETPIWTKGHKV